MHPAAIILFVVLVVGLLIVDLFVVGKKSHKITTKEAGIWTLVFVAVSLAFAGFLHNTEGPQMASEFLSAYVIEKILSVDNLFVFILVFGFFKVPDEYQHKVLFWGIAGAIILRAIFIFVGVGLIEATYLSVLGIKLNLIILAFGGFLIYAGVKSAIGLFKGEDDEDEDYSNSPGAKAIRWLFGGKVAENYDGDKFFTKLGPGGKFKAEDGIAVQLLKTYATPLLVVVGVIEFTDLLFAVDSIPAIFSVSKDPFVLYTSNIFAILGLRSMYFLLSNLLPLFRYLNHGLAVILTFIGVKMVGAPWFHIESNTSLFIVLGILAVSVTTSLIFRDKTQTT